MNLKRLVSFAVAIIMAAGISGCSGVSGNYASMDSSGHQDLGSEFPVLTATGYSVVSVQPGKTQDQKILQAMRASKIDAYRELSEQVYGMQIDAGTTIRDVVQLDNTVEASVSGFVRGAKVVRTYPVSPNVYATELQLDTKLLHKFYLMRGTL